MNSPPPQSSFAGLCLKHIALSTKWRKQMSYFQELRKQATLGACLFALLSNSVYAGQTPSAAIAAEHQKTESPIKHLIVVIGENRTFDHLFATYVPKSEDSVSNLLSKGIITADGKPGKHFSKAAQFQAVAPFKKKFFISLDKDEKAPYQILPSPSLNFSPTATIFPPGTPTNFLEAVEPSLEAGDEFLLTTGAATG